jgi:Domain of unknown function (DUF222)/HNH endonuclease
MASDLSTSPASPGLTSQVADLSERLGALVDALDPDTLLGADAAALYGDVCRMERLVVAAKTLLAPRIAASGHWESEGHRSPADLLATLEGGSAGQAKRTLETGQRLSSLPSVEEAMRAGKLSGAKAAEITDAATCDPGAESQLLAGSEHESLRATKERCQRVKATSAKHDPLATAQRIHANRSFAHWTDSDGAFHYQGQDTPERGAALMARLVPMANHLRSARRAAASDGAAPPPPEPEAALRADAFFLLVGGGGGADAGGSGPADADDLVSRPPMASVIVRVDRDALVRGRAEPGELCELDGHGPIPVPLAAALAVDSFLCLVFTEAGDIKAVSHVGRTINQKLRTALVFRDRTCVVPGCSMPYGLEIDHVRPMEFGGPTTLDNLALLCHHHHRLKTYEGWVLERHGPTDDEPGWSFTPQAPFGQEPGLGIDRPPEARPRK